jgi:hypothetical protein
MHFATPKAGRAGFSDLRIPWESRMAGTECDREDLMREATALRRRVELQLPGERIVAGYRGTGAFSIYFGQDRAYHFDPQGLLRRAFVHPDLYRTQGTTLARLTRERTSARTLLLRRDLPSDELRAFLVEVRTRLSHLAGTIAAGRAAVLRCVPADADLLSEVAATVRRIGSAEVRLALPVPGKR